MNDSNRSQRPVALWLLICCAMIFGMVVLGGVTRLTGSGLSMVKWNPIFGVVPPLSQARWEKVFHQYRQSPEYKDINVGMDLAGFKKIYWFEYTHRLLGRTIGLVFLLPFLYFLARRRLDRPLIPRLVVMFVLGGLQGLLGWYMVKSGLVSRPHVSQYRLTAHLGTALVIYSFILWVALDLLFPRHRRRCTPPPALRRLSLAVLGLVAVTVLAGGFVAGLKAGYAYNTFPLMDGHLIPEAIFYQHPLWRNFFENIATVQFDHRLLATLTFCAVIGLWLAARRYELPPRLRLGYHLLLAMVAIQVSLGISTLLLHVPIPLAAAHQAGAVVLLTLLVYLNHGLWEGRAESRNPGRATAHNA
ncbi:MAG TPA: COX15/CtaA family protein [Gammaproteobacteria bacterium]|nr:COX15/CtaA family protein [Gammaproteobacteria bacterium]